MYRGADAFVLPTRGEGWGLPIAEAMASNLPVIGNFSGPTAFLTDDNSYPLRTAQRLPGGQAEPSVADVAQAMKRVRENTEEARRKGERARADMAAKFSRTSSRRRRARGSARSARARAGGASPLGKRRPRRASATSCEGGGGSSRFLVRAKLEEVCGRQVS